MVITNRAKPARQTAALLSSEDHRGTRRGPAVQGRKEKDRVVSQ